MLTKFVVVVFILVSFAFAWVRVLKRNETSA